MIIVSIIFSVLLSLILFLLSINVLGGVFERNVNKNIVFECGIMRDKLRRKSFSLRFFLFVVLFLVFEIEIILFLPCRLLQDFMLDYIVNLLIGIILLLGGGLVYE